MVVQLAKSGLKDCILLHALYPKIKFHNRSPDGTVSEVVNLGVGTETTMAGSKKNACAKKRHYGLNFWSTETPDDVIP